ncbi:hypothetical protein ACOMHN_037036 [Nucella lapillus]
MNRISFIRGGQTHFVNKLLHPLALIILIPMEFSYFLDLGHNQSLVAYLTLVKIRLPLPQLPRGVRSDRPDSSPCLSNLGYAEKSEGSEPPVAMLLSGYQTTPAITYKPQI